MPAHQRPGGVVAPVPLGVQVSAPVLVQPARVTAEGRDLDSTGTQGFLRRLRDEGGHDLGDVDCGSEPRTGGRPAAAAMPE
ncbi:Uncharacterised protein [Mycobacteroides abscessus subsp. massiliense]|nr:Uncharacterised protein [Mycobacteroides abscessus subsp. massiliense]